MELVKEKEKKAFDILKETFGYTNPMQTPRLQKIIVTNSFGSIKDPNKIKLIEDRLTRITGQKPVKTLAKQSIAAFKIRQGNPIGYKVTLRGHRMHDFLDRLLNIALPRTRDFKGIAKNGIDAMGNYTLGIREHVVFPETADEDIKDVFGMNVTVVTTAKTKEEAEAFFRTLGFPFKKEAQVKK